MNIYIVSNAQARFHEKRFFLSTMKVNMLYTVDLDTTSQIIFAIDLCEEQTENALIFLSDHHCYWIDLRS